MTTSTTERHATAWGAVIRRLAPLAIMSLMLIAATGCTESDSGETACEQDDACPRGTICQSGACTTLQCARLGDCPGSGRTCLEDLLTCSLKECAAAVNGAVVECAQGQVCRESGPHAGTCLDGCNLDSECGDGLRCCDGVCGDCPAMDMSLIPGDDMGPAGDTGPAGDGDVPGDTGPMTDTGPTPDQGMMGGALCAPCGSPADCAELGEGATCTPIGNTGSFCTSACAGADDCPAGYTCLANVQQCVPANYDCSLCPARPCQGGDVCDVATGACVAPSQVCEECTDDSRCAPGLRCDQAGGRSVCLSDCAGGGGCPDGYACEGDLCRPEGGACDACNGACQGLTPVCLQAEGRCVECDALNPCGGDLVCDLETNACVEQGGDCGCVQDRDCEACLGLPICFGGRCVQCLDDSECPPRFACNENQQCIRAPCRGVQCQAGAMCDPAQGVCVNQMGQPACTSPQDCALPDTMGCNVNTGQCYYLDGGCDPPGGDGVCAPGGRCNAVLPGLESCTCERQNPLGMPPGPEIISCQPGGACIHGEAFPPGSGMPAPEGFCLHFGG